MDMGKRGRRQETCSRYAADKRRCGERTDRQTYTQTQTQTNIHKHMHSQGKEAIPGAYLGIFAVCLCGAIILHQAQVRSDVGGRDGSVVSNADARSQVSARAHEKGATPRSRENSATSPTANPSAGDDGQAPKKFTEVADGL
eukprot:746152-Hanusia_phi.AAC.5